MSVVKLSMTTRLPKLRLSSDGDDSIAILNEFDWSVSAKCNPRDEYQGTR